MSEQDRKNDQTPFGKFKELARNLLAVSKDEVAKKAKRQRKERKPKYPKPA